MKGSMKGSGVAEALSYGLSGAVAWVVVECSVGSPLAFTPPSNFRES